MEPPFFRTRRCNACKYSIGQGEEKDNTDKAKENRLIRPGRTSPEGDKLMMLEEAQARLKTTKITEEQLWGLNSLYCLLDLDKDDFCKIVDTVGIEKLLSKQELYERYEKAEQELFRKERYLSAKSRLAELANEKVQLEEIVSRYERCDLRGGQAQ